MKDSINILVVDDNQENLKVVSNILKEKGYKIALALDGNEALKILDEYKIDLILLDVMMPDMDGITVCKTLKQNESLSEIPVIFLTALNESKYLVEGFKAGGVDYITKPFNREELLTRVKTHLDMSASKKELVETIKTRDKLYSIIAHDLRSPLLNIAMLMGLIIEDVIDPKSMKYKEMILQLNKSVRETNTLLNNLLEWTRMQVGALALKPEKLPVNKVIKDCIQLLDGNAKQKKIAISNQLNDSAVAYFDEITMHAVFRNILSNAIKFTKDNGMINIRSQISENYLEVVIQDNGIGMTKELIEKIFEKNEVHTSFGTANEQGSGLGLFLVKDMVEQNNGFIQVESEKDKGTSIKICIPMQLTGSV